MASPTVPVSEEFEEEEDVSKVQDEINIEEIDNEAALGGTDDVDIRLARELNKMSVDERNQVFYDVHGVSDVITENQELISKCLEAFQKELQLPKWKNNPIFVLAKRQSPSYLERIQFRLKFLRADSFQPKVAAERMIRFLERKNELFGKDSLTRDITLKDFTKEDMECMESGVVQLLPTTDQAGRVVLAINPTIAKPFSFQSLMRVYFYVVMSATDSEEHQKIGMVKITYNVGPNRSSDARLIRRTGQIIRALPIRIVGSHMCVMDDPLHHVLIALSKLVIGKHDRVRFRAHYGTHDDTMASLQTYGIPKPFLPYNGDYTPATENHKEWLRKQLKAANIDPNEKDPSASSGIDMPRYYDVLFGRGKTISDHPGNLRLHRFLELYQERYEKAKKLQKATIASEIVGIVRQSGGRFLRQVGDKWVEVDKEEAREKVSRTFRNRRAALSSQNNKDKLQQQQQQQNVLPAQSATSTYLSIDVTPSPINTTTSSSVQQEQEQQQQPYCFANEGEQFVSKRPRVSGVSTLKKDI